MSDRVALGGQSTRNEHMCDRNACEAIWRIREPVWRLEHPFSNHDERDKCANRRFEYGNRSRYQTEHFKHIPVVLHMKIKSWIILTRSHQLPGPQAGLLLPVKFYMVCT